MVSQSFTIDVAGNPMQAYLARPDENAIPRPAVIVLQEISGVKDPSGPVRSRSLPKDYAARTRQTPETAYATARKEHCA